MYRTERGQILPLFAVALFIGFLVMSAAAKAVNVMVLEIRIQNAADAAALAAVQLGAGAAREAAAANDAEVVRLRIDGREATVTVRNGDHEGTAKARSG